MTRRPAMKIAFVVSLTLAKAPSPLSKASLRNMVREQLFYRLPIAMAVTRVTVTPIKEAE